MLRVQKFARIESSRSIFRDWRCGFCAPEVSIRINWWVHLILWRNLSSVSWYFWKYLGVSYKLLFSLIDSILTLLFCIFFRMGSLLNSFCSTVLSPSLGMIKYFNYISNTVFKVIWFSIKRWESNFYYRSDSIIELD